MITCNDDFIGLYVVQSTESDCIVHILKDAMVQMNLSLDNCRGQCYDGAANMAGRKKSSITDIVTGVESYLYSLLRTCT